MPILFRASCNKCDYLPEVTANMEDVTLEDNRDDGAVLPDNYLEYHAPDGSIMALPSTAEGLSLEQKGVNWHDAARNGQLIMVTHKVCLDCGALNKDARVYDSRDGCLIGILAAVVTFLFGKFAYGLQYSQAMLLAYPALILPYIVGRVLYRKRWKSKNAESRLEACSACGSGLFGSLMQASKRKNRCPQCEKSSLTYTIAGKS